MAKWLLLFFFSLPIFFPEGTYAHAFGQQYTLPVPLWLYLYGSAAVLIISFLIIGYFLNAKKAISLSSYPVYIFKKPWLSSRLLMFLLVVLRLISVFLLLFTILTGVFGVNEAISNFSMTYFWIVLMLGVTYLSAILGNIWALLNPWHILADWEERIRKTKLNGIFSYPHHLSYYPALLFYFIFIWFELIGKITPHELGFILFGYTLLSNIGVALIGKQSWFSYCDFFSVFFRLIGKISPFFLVQGNFALRPPFVGLLKECADNFSLLLFVLFMLASTAFDGFHATSVYQKFLFSSPLVDSISLFNFLIVFFVVYVVSVFAMKFVSKTKYSIIFLCFQLAFSLIPIALAYNIAHYYTLLLIQGQAIIALFSDPFGIGWNLFGTATFTPNIQLISTNFIWNSQVVVILIGHIAGVYVAHVMSLQMVQKRKSAWVGQLPILFLMVLYTMFGLWILAQPIVGA